ncbi:hypothetical protein [Streptomyces sp. NPDC046197]|uniref:hypothetical protein n=1 Tax=Streptomyces sp. NPDC046197 TaxID=3154337 RepID=UPI003411F21C
MSFSLRPDALAGRRLAISASQSPDASRSVCGDEDGVRLTLRHIARAVLAAGGHLAYGGNLAPGGFTPLLVEEAGWSGREDQPLVVTVPWSEHRRMSLAELRTALDAGPAVRVVWLDVAGREVDPAAGRGAAPEEVDPHTTATALHAMRRHVRDRCDGRVLVGGRRSGFSGSLPGVLEEAMLSLEGSPQPLYSAAGFGGVAADVARALRIDDSSWLPHEHGAADPRLAEGLDRLRVRVRELGGSALTNGLSPEENRRLAVSVDPSEIAALVTLGLARAAS